MNSKANGIRLIILFKFLVLLLFICPAALFAQPDYNLKVNKPVAISPYKIWQKDQLYAFKGMANVTNLGTKPMQNPKLKLDLFDASSNLIWTDSMMYSSDNTPMPGSFYPVNKPGTYSGVYTVSQDSTDADLSDNQQSFSWKVDNNVMSKEDIGELGTGLTPTTNSKFSWGNIYYITNGVSKEGKQLHCNEIQIGIANANELEGASVFGWLYKWDNLNNNSKAEELERTTVGFTQYYFTGLEPSNKLFTMPISDFNTLDDGVLLESNTSYILAVEYIPPASNLNLKCKILADPNLDYSLNSIRDSLDQTKVYANQVLDIGNTGTYTLNTLNNATPVIRMVIAPDKDKSYVYGKVYLDFDCDHVFNNQDQPVADNYILDQDLAYPAAQTDAFGDYSIVLNEINEYTFGVVHDGATIKSYPNTYTINNDSLGKVFTGMDYAFCFVNSFHDVAVDLAGYIPPKPGFDNSYNICVKNYGSYFENAQLVFNFIGGDADNYVDIIDADGGTVNGHTITWDINNLIYYGEVCKKLVIHVHANTPLGTTFTPHVKVSLDPNIVESKYYNNEISQPQLVVGSYDPNDKSVDKEGFTSAQLKDGVNLEYFIRFQNTGTYPASFIEVYDTLSSSLSIMNFKMISASHHYTLTIIDNHILKWRFDNINLPDSASNEVGSHGYIKFSINTVPNLSKTDVISNSAAIYFDFNTPVITNAIKTSFVVATHNLAAENNLPVMVYPNPVSNITQVKYTLAKRMNCRMELMDPSGRLVLVKGAELPKGEQKEIIDMTDYTSGVHFLRIYTEEGMGEATIVKQ